MNMNKDQCALCGESLKSAELNLQSSVSQYSGTSLICLIEKITGSFTSLHYCVCLCCFNLINELDAIELRQTEIHNLLRRYVQNSEPKSIIKSKNFITSSITDEIRAQIRQNNQNMVPKTEKKIEGINKIKDNLYSINDRYKSTLNDEDTDKSNINNEPLFSQIKIEGCSYENEPMLNTGTNSNSIVKKIKKLPKKLQVYNCHCSMEFRTSRELKIHMKSHNLRQSFVCDICGLHYKFEPSFNRHINMHKGIHPFTCVYCNKTFTQKGALVRHAPIHTGEKPYQCDECGKRFIHHTSFGIHRLSHTGQKSHKCSVCGLAFMSGSHVKRHMRIHTGEKKFPCSICGRRFAERYNLAVHEKLHSNPKSILSINTKLRVQENGGQNWNNAQSAKN
ncbi:hypothetical protein NQ317_005878 [Molorchus minor]|uniref:C2H2-type domain-containing protein n=1 Tax=Molorchus minor TaxID=1323400 RepID=A0ABQ9JZ88_9CUCU|nr:hypothetical protein NQ317_005878 [Molorchus minor]